MIFRTICLAAILFISVINASKDRNDKPYKVVCYWGSWSFYRADQGKFSPEDANPYLCTHMIYGFTKLNHDNTIGVFDPDLDLGDTDYTSGLSWGRGMYRRWNHLRTVNPNMTTLIAIGGWNEGSDKYSRMAGDAGARSTFVNSVVKFLRKYDFDGFDVDWEYPAMKASGEADRKPGNDADKANYIQLLKQLREAFDPYGYILTAAVSAGRPTIDRAYNVPEMSKYLDFINLMTYDFHGAWDTNTAHNAPLYAWPNDTEADKQFTTEYAVNHWLKLGVEPKKLVMGMALYGRTYTLATPNECYLGAKVVGKGGVSGPITRQIGMLGYNEICSYLKTGNWRVVRDDVQKIPYACSGDQWIGYDDEQSIQEKVNFIKSKGLGGGMVWSIDTDDFRGLCHDVKYPLLKIISKGLNSEQRPDPVIVEVHATPRPTSQPPNPWQSTEKPAVVPVSDMTSPQPPKPTTKPPKGGSANTTTTTTTTTKPPKGGSVTNTTTSTTTTEPPKGGSASNATTTTTTTTTTKPPILGSGSTFVCKQEGLWAEPTDPRIFHNCAKGNGKLTDNVILCGSGTVWNDDKKVCDWPKKSNALLK